MPDLKRVPVTVSVDSASADKLDEVAARLRAAGMDVAQTHSCIGAISGEIDPACCADLLAIPGVAAVERARGACRQPPDSSTQ